MHLVRLEIEYDETSALESALIPAVEEGHVATIGRELGMGDEMIGVGHRLLGLQFGKLLQAYQHLALVGVEIDEVKACSIRGKLIEQGLIVAYGVAVTGHEPFQAPIAESGGPMAIGTHAIDRPTNKTMLACSHIADGSVEPVALARIIYKVGIVEPLQSATLMVIPGVGFAQSVPLAIALACIVTHQQGIVFGRHAEGYGEAASQQTAIIATEGFNIMETEETVFDYHRLVMEARIVVWQQVVEGLIDVANGIFQEIIILDALIDKGL